MSSLTKTFVLVFQAFAPLAFCQLPSPVVFSKEPRPGIIYRQEIRPSVPLVIHSLTFKFPAEGLRLETAMGGSLVLGEGSLGRSTVGQLARSAGAFAAINADFFYPNGDPTGLFVHHSEVLSEPTAGRSVVAFTDTGLVFDAPSWSCALRRPDGKALKVDGINRFAHTDELVLVTDNGGKAVSHGPAIMLVFETRDRLIAGRPAELVFKHAVPDVTSLQVAKGQLIAVATGRKKAEVLTGLEQNTRYRVNLSLFGTTDWTRVRFALSGGPRLLTDGRVSIDPAAEGFDRNLANTRHPRTAIGRKHTGEAVLLVVDGRSSISAGVTLDELATILLSMGCRDAINLDGGGSSTMLIAGRVLNRPSDGRERPVANGLLLFAPEEPLRVKAVGIDAPVEHLAVGQTVRLSVLTADGDCVPQEDVLWVAETGNAWVDQGGSLVALSAGKAVVRAITRGSEARIEITIAPRKP